ncbi:GNAT family N-acetyltransferase [Microbacterium sp. CFBP9034]|uniref:GNAT family N-acetyltransferase n=1 Tax=Microbacterium sp. CFBP9034 TaxID=3096540 RepID=UPI002A69B94F|nr:GNAT family N-acetyltransferase [Microbacterium sp. CFBP9034]MDY0909702.1 GNAT family N-acetyltransferase [Microbacterium sp. CFBP9034]
MTDLMFADAAVTTAVSAAESAAQTAGVEVREIVGISEQAEVVRLLSSIWGRSPDNPPVPPELLRAFGKAGNYIAGAFAGSELVGATVAFHSTPERRALHSHIAGVTASHVGRSVGFAMKLHQRGWALARGIDAIEWTFDPLVARNAHFNVAKLRARPVEYLTNFYGEMGDAINGDDETDRLLVRWELRDGEVEAAAAAHPIVVDASGPRYVAIAVPPDIERLRADDLASARLWRRRVREQFTALLGAGGQVVGFDRSAGYVVRLADGGIR